METLDGLLGSADSDKRTPARIRMLDGNSRCLVAGTMSLQFGEFADHVQDSAAVLRLPFVRGEESSC